MKNRRADSSETRRFPGHRWALGFLIVVLAVWGLAMWGLSKSADLPDTGYGTVLVVFPPAMTPKERLFTVARADGVVIAETGVPGTWLVRSEREGFAGRLRAAGAMRVFRESDLDSINVNGCFGGAPNLRALFRDDATSRPR